MLPVIARLSLCKTSSGSSQQAVRLMRPIHAPANLRGSNPLFERCMVDSRALTRLSRCSMRLYSTVPEEHGSSESTQGSKVARIYTTTSGSHQDITPEQLKDLLRESEKRKNLILIWAIAAFLAADISLLLVWYLLSDDDPESPNYVPEDWKSLVLTNLGLSRPVTVPAQLVGAWKSDDNEIITFQPSGTFSKTELLPNSDELRLQAKGTVFSADAEYITVKTTTTQRIRIDQLPQQNPGGWSMQLDGKRFKKELYQKDSL